MKNLIGGLFETQENANLAYEALQRSGFPDDDIRMFIHKPRNKVIRSARVRIQDIAMNVILGALILGLVGALIGFRVGNGTISLPYLEPGSAPRGPLFVFMSVLWGLITGGLTGAILGAASRLLRSREKAELMTREIDKRGVIVTVHADGEGMKSEGSVRRIMEEHHAVKIGNPHEQWDMKDWVSPNENQPSLANTR
jgi:hypothetical protein